MPDSAAPVTGPAALRSRLASGDVVITAEIGPPRGADPAAIGAAAGPLRGWVDALNVTDGPGGSVRMSSLAGSVLALAAGVEPVMQLTCRDRNRIALQADLLGAAALGVRNVLLMTGDHPQSGDHPQARPVFDLDGVQLVQAARGMRDHGAAVRPGPGQRAGLADRCGGGPIRPGGAAGHEGGGGRRVRADPVRVRRAAVRPVAERGPRPGPGPALRDPGQHPAGALDPGAGAPGGQRARGADPAALAGRLRGVPAGQVAAEGLRICADTIQHLLQLPGVRGIHLMAPGFEHGVPEILDLAGMARAH